MPSSPSSIPSYKRWAIIMARFTLKRSLREASCWNLLVVNGAVGLRRRSRFSTELNGPVGASRAQFLIFFASSSLGTSFFSSPLPMKPRIERRRLRTCKMRVDRPVLLLDERLDLALALDDQAQSDSLYASGGKSTPNFVPQQRRNLVSDQAVQYAARLLRVDQVAIDIAGMIERFLHGALA